MLPGDPVADAVAHAYDAPSQDIEGVLLAAELDEHYGVSVDFIQLLDENAAVAHSIVQSPKQMLDALETSLLSAQVLC